MWEGGREDRVGSSFVVGSGRTGTRAVDEAGGRADSGEGRAARVGSAPPWKCPGGRKVRDGRDGRTDGPPPLGRLATYTSTVRPCTRLEVHGLGGWEGWHAGRCAFQSYLQPR